MFEVNVKNITKGKGKKGRRGGGGGGPAWVWGSDYKTNSSYVVILIPNKY